MSLPQKKFKSENDLNNNNNNNSKKKNNNNNNKKKDQNNNNNGKKDQNNQNINLTSEDNIIQCCLKKCTSKAIQHGIHSYVFCCVNPNSTKQTAGIPKQKEERKHFAANWSGEQNAFHSECYQALEELFQSKTASGLSSSQLAQHRHEKRLFKEANETAEHFESFATIDEKVQLLKQMILGSKYVVAFTGAGISTSAGIGDYRGPQGKWTLQNLDREVEDVGVKYEDLKITPTHRGLAAMINNNPKYLHFVISQNCDNLHRRSGISRNDLAELHGNVMCEFCPQCAKNQPARSLRDDRSGLWLEHNFYALNDSVDQILDLRDEKWGDGWDDEIRKDFKKKEQQRIKEEHQENANSSNLVQIKREKPKNAQSRAHLKSPSSRNISWNIFRGKPVPKKLALPEWADICSQCSCVHNTVKPIPRKAKEYKYQFQFIS